MSRANIHERVAANTRLKCEAKGCTRNRTWTKCYCAPCSRNWQHNGDPNARAIYPGDYAAHLNLVRVLFTKYPHSAALLEADRRMRECLDPGLPVKRKVQGNGAEKWHAWKQRTRLKDGKLDPRLALEHAVAVMFLAHEQPARFPTARIESCAVANAIFRLVPYFGYVHWNPKTQRNYTSHVLPPCAGALTVLGEQVRMALWPFARTVAKQIEAEMLEENRRKAAIYKPLEERTDA